MNESEVRKHIRKFLEKQGYDVWDIEEKEIIPGVKADLVASTRGRTKKVLAVETKGSNGNVKKAVGQASTYLISDLISQSYIAIPKDLLAKSGYVKQVCETAGVGLLAVDDSGEVRLEQRTTEGARISSASLWGNRRNGAPDTNRVEDLKLAVLAVADAARTREEIISYIQCQRTKIKSSEPIGAKWAQVFIDDATQMGLMIRRLDGAYILSPLGKTLLQLNPNSDVTDEERKLLRVSILNFPVAYMVFRILRERATPLSKTDILEEGKRMESEISIDGVFQTELRRKYHLNKQRLSATLNLMKDLGVLEATPVGVRLSSL